MNGQGHKITKFCMQNSTFLYPKFNFIFIRPLSLKFSRIFTVILWKITEINDFD